MLNEPLMNLSCAGGIVPADAPTVLNLTLWVPDAISSTLT